MGNLYLHIRSDSFGLTLISNAIPIRLQTDGNGKNKKYNRIILKSVFFITIIILYIQTYTI